MITTITTFKQQQDKAKDILNKLKRFVQDGEDLGMNIDLSVAKKITNVSQAVSENKLKVALIGGFSEGKTSIAAAWLGDVDKKSMKISEQESSNEICTYEIGNDIILIDTPGLFGFKEQQNTDSQSIEKYKEITKKYISEAHLVLYVMNPTNPIKDSHKEDLDWLFRTLNLLPRTVFVLSRFDEVADVSDDLDYRQNLEIKCQNVAKRLDDLITLSDDEKKNLVIVGLSANPFDMGIEEHWLHNINQYKQYSRIDTLQEATNEVIDRNGGILPIVYEAQKSVIQDVLTKQLPIADKKNQLISKEVEFLTKSKSDLEMAVRQSEANLINAEHGLIRFITEYFKDLIIQVNNCGLESFGSFVSSEIGSSGEVILAKVNSEFKLRTQAVSNELDSSVAKFNQGAEHFNSIINVAQIGGSKLASLNLITKETVLATRDGIVSIAKFFGGDISKYLKFKPWGATNLAKGLNGTVAVIGLGLELWDSYSQAQKENEVKKAIQETADGLGRMQKELLEKIQSDDFKSYFPLYTALEKELKNLENRISNSKNYQKRFEAWCKEGEIIDVAFKVIN